jgi:transcriptional regulator with XRE-family HTH domain
MPKSLFTKRYAIFREQLQHARTQAGVSQEELAKKMGWDQTYVSKIERGVRGVDVVELIGICEVLGLDASLFVKRLGEKMGRR